MALIRLVYSDAKEFAAIVEAIAAVLEEAAFVVTSEGMRLRAVDPSRTVMIDLAIPSEGFETYEVNAEEVVLGLDFSDFKKQLRRIKKGDKLILELREGEHKLRVTVQGQRSKRTLLMPLIDVQRESLPEPKIAATVIAKLLSDALKEAISDADVVADEVTFYATESGLRIVAHSEKAECTAEFERGSESLFEYEVREPAKARYSLDVLTDIVKKGAKISDIVELSFATGKPLKLVYNIVMGGYMTFYVAPMVE